MQAIILAAGMGKRLKELTKDNTKCMVKVNNITLIERLLHMLDCKRLSKIVMVVGYRGNELMEYVRTLHIKTDIVFIDNPIYQTTNNIYSLSLADDYLTTEDTLLFESDLIFEEEIIDKLISDKRESLAVVDKFESWMDGTCMVLDGNDNIVDFIPGKYIEFFNKDKYYKTVNIYKFSKHFSENIYVPFLEAYRKAMGQNEYYESVIKLIAMLGTNEIKAMRLDGQKWYEIDDIQDLDIAETLFAEESGERYSRIISRYGGYWRYPQLVDFCYLVNPFFPTTRMLDEIESNFAMLVRNYPSGMEVNSLLAGRNFGIKKTHVVVGNGAAELIKELFEQGDLGRVGMILPTFEEYPNRNKRNGAVFYVPDSADFSYTAQDIMNYFGCNSVDTLILINPDNPSGNYIPYHDLLKLIKWSKENRIKLIVDESFVDFVDTECDKTLINEEILSIYNDLYVVKSISKSFGIPGLRLGVVASSNETIISRMKKAVSIWNINSIGEFYMQIYEKYAKDYLISLKKVIDCRKVLSTSLKKVSYLRVIPSQANYLMCEVADEINCEYLINELLDRNILIKNLSSKINNGKQYIRIAVRTREDNEYLVKNLLEIGKDTIYE